MAKLYKRRAVSLKTESAQNTPAVAVPSDYIPAFDFSCTPVIEQLDSTVVSQNLGSPANTPGLKNYDFDISYWLKGSGVAGTALATVDATLGICGITGSGGYYYANSSLLTNYYGPSETATIVGNYDGIKHAITGAVGNLEMTFEQGKKVVVHVTGKGLYGSAVDAALPSGSFGATIEPTVQSIGFNIGGLALTADKFSFNIGNVIAAISDVNSANGINSYVITDRKPVGTLTALAVNVATHDFFGRLDTGTTATGSLVVGTSAGNMFAFNFASVQYTDVKYSNVNGLINVEATLKFNETDTTNPWLQIIVL